MYFSTLNNEELKYFHKGLNTEFSITLTEILESNNGVFMVETIRTNKLYRIYPVFYCKEIITSNPLDKLISTQCIIANKTDTETYYTFNTSNSEDPIYSTDETIPTAWNHELLTKTIGDELNTNEFNTMVYIMRRHNQLGGTLDFEDTNTIQGLYGSYTLTDDSRLRNDVGFIINDDLKENPLTIKLTNPFFVVADYRVTFTVKSITGANIYEDSSLNHITEDTFTVSLVDDTLVSLDLTSYTNDSVLLFKSDLNILFNIPEIVNNNFTLGLVTDKLSYYPGETITVTATLTADVSVTGYNIVFYLDNGGKQVASTNSSGVASTTFTSTVSGSHVLKAEVLGITTQKNISITKKTTSISLTASKLSVGVDESFNYTVTLLNTFDNTPLAGTSFRLYEGDSYTTLTTGEDGTYTGTLSYSNPGAIQLQARYLGATSYEASESTIRTINVNRYETDLTFTVTDTTTYIGDNDAYSLTLIDNSDNPISNATVKIYQNDSLYATVTTDNNGEATGNLTHTHSGLYTYYAVYEGSGEYAGDTSITTNVTVNKLPTSITYTGATSGKPEESKTISGILNDSHNNTVISGATIRLTVNGTTYNLTTDNNGAFSQNVTFSTAGSYTVKMQYYGTNTYMDATKTQTINVNKKGSTLTLSTNKATVDVDEPYTLTATLKDGNIPMRNKTLIFYRGTGTILQRLGSSTTNNNGVATYNGTQDTAGTRGNTAEFKATDEYNGAKATVNQTVNMSNTSIQVTAPSTTPVNKSWSMDIKVLNSSGTPIYDYYWTSKVTVTATGNRGYSATKTTNVGVSERYPISMPSSANSGETITYSVSYHGLSNKYNPSTSATKTIIVG